MEDREIIEKIKAAFGESSIQPEEGSDMLTLVVKEKNYLHDVMALLKNEMGFDFLTDVCGVHYPEQALPLGVIYHLQHLKERKRIRIKIFVSVNAPYVPSLVDIFAAANWMERETYDFYGILFEGHPNLKRILNVEYMDYFPMRKEYPLEDATRTDKDDRFFGR